jgi:hypothetical protein
MHRLAWFLVALFALPYLGQEIPLVNRLPGSLVSYANAASLALLALTLCFLRPKRLTTLQKLLVGYFGLCIAVSFIKIAFSGLDFRTCIQLSNRLVYPFVFASLICLHYAVASERGFRQQFVHHFSVGILLFVVLQFLVGIPEARGRAINQKHAGFEDRLDKSEMLDSRDVLSGGSASRSIIQKLGFKRPFCGGFTWFNDYGVMVAVINVLVLLRFIESLQWKYALFSAFLLFCAIASTTKTAMIAVILANGVFVLAVPRRFRPALIVIVGIAFALVFERAFIYMWQQKGGEGTWLLRLDIWKDYLVATSRLVGVDPLQILFGINLDTHQALQGQLHRVVFATENEFLLIGLYYGVVGLCLYLTAIGSGVFLARRSGDKSRRLLAWTLLGVVVLCGTTMDCLNRHFTLPIIAFILINLEQKVQLAPIPVEQSLAPQASIRIPALQAQAMYKQSYGRNRALLPFARRHSTNPLPGTARRPFSHGPVSRSPEHR